MSKNITHDSSQGHVTGESDFIDDRTPLRGELRVGIVSSPIAHGKIRSIHFEEALKVKGVAGIFTYRDLAHNRWGSVFQDQPLLAEDFVQYVGEPVLVIAAEFEESIQEARRLIRIEFDELPALLNVSDARKAQSFIGPLRKIECGNVDQALAQAPHRLKGVLNLAGQEHFYLESHAAIAYPGEKGQIEIHSSSQHPSEVQHVVAHALGLHYKDVVCIVKRMGGAFGGKESQAAHFAGLAALVAQKTRRAARLILTKDEDMLMTGKRNPFEIHYEIGFDSQGKIQALIANHYSNGGAYADLSTAIMERAMLHSDNAYFIPNARITGQVCKTNFHPHTAFRGFGGPKGVALIENIIEDIAQTLGLDALDVRKINLYKKGQSTPYGQVIEQDMLRKLFEKIEQTSDYQTRRREMREFNQSATTHIRGMSLTAVKFGISFTTRFLNQAVALVNVHLDGTLQVSTGATEMGQGVNTKIAQAVAQVFGISEKNVEIMPTSTEKTHNTSPTAASSGSDLNGQAAINAAMQIRNRLEELATVVLNRPVEMRGRKAAATGNNPEIVLKNQSAPQIVFENGCVFDSNQPSNKISFSDLLNEAYLNRISLGGYGFHRYPGIFFDKETGKGNAFYYFTHGVAVSEIEIDTFTGEVKVLRADLLMDLGRPLNPGIDRGQVTGAFIQGMGWVTTEKLFYDSKGALRSISPSTYKIPSIQDIPRIFNVDFLVNDENQKNFAGSKAVGEPPLLLGISVWTAIKDAIRSQKGSQIRALGIPATQEDILLGLQ